MRHLKLMGVAAIAVFALVAFAGATTASATKLCSVNTSPCPAGNTYPHRTIHASLSPGTNAVLTTSGGIINPSLTCGASGVTLTATAAPGTDIPLSGHLVGLSFTSCTSVNPTGCENTGTVGSLAGATGTVAATTGGNGTLRLTPPTVSFSCPILGSTVTCTFGGSGTVDGTVTGSATDPTVHIVNQAIASTGGAGCPTASNWNARYTVNNPTALFVTTN